MRTHHFFRTICVSVLISTAGAISVHSMSADRNPGETCDTAVIINTLPFAVTGSTATYQDDYDAVCPYSGSTAPDIVYMYTPPATVLIDAVLCGDATDFDTALYIYENDCTAGTEIACNDDFCRTASMAWTYVSLLQQIELTGGTTYYIVVDGHRWARGNYELTIQLSTGDPMLPDPEW